MQLHPRCWGWALSRHVWSWNVTAISLSCWSESDEKAIREQLVRILNSGPFHQSQRRQRFLEYLVNETLSGRGERLKAYNVALEVFERPETFDPITDPLVRIEAARLREKLREYYGTEGQSGSAAHSWCTIPCTLLGVTTPATQADHIERLVDKDHFKRTAWEGLQALCAEHHRRGWRVANHQEARDLPQRGGEGLCARAPRGDHGRASRSVDPPPAAAPRRGVKREGAPDLSDAH